MFVSLVTTIYFGLEFRGGMYSSKTSEYFDPESKTWKDGPELNFGRIQHCMVEAGGRFLLLGGSYDSGRVDGYDMSSQVWNRMSNQVVYRQR